MVSNRETSSSPSMEVDSNSNSINSSTDTAHSIHGVQGATASQPAGAGMDTSAEDSLPKFLNLSRSEIHNKFIDLEWQQRNRLAQGGLHTPDNVSQWARMTGEEVVRRNRYMNVDPFVNNRIRLKVPEGHSDYINASFIELKSSLSGTKKDFIATQGPKEGIYGHVWRMIWHECADPAVIVMLTQTYESGREKCFQYFPFDMENPVLPINEEDEFEDGFVATLTLKDITEDKETSSTIREMELRTADGATKTVWHMLFGGWPDYSIPEGKDINGLIQLVALSQEKAPKQDSPRVVHCSAGVGRTGTFIALDWLLTELREGSFDHLANNVDPISDVVDKLREQRMMMVQGEQQFCFLYDVLKRLWLDRIKGDRIKLQVDGAGSSPEEKLRAELEQEMKDNAERI